MLEAVPGGIEGGVLEPVRAGEVDDHGAGRHPERRGALVVEAAEDELRPARERLLVRDEVRHAGAEPRVQHPRSPAGQRVRPERDEVERRVGEDAVECLLA